MKLPYYKYSYLQALNTLWLKKFVYSRGFLITHNYNPILIMRKYKKHLRDHPNPHTAGDQVKFLKENNRNLPAQIVS